MYVLYAEYNLYTVHVCVDVHVLVYVQYIVVCVCVCGCGCVRRVVHVVINLLCYAWLSLPADRAGFL